MTGFSLHLMLFHVVVVVCWSLFVIVSALLGLHRVLGVSLILSSTSTPLHLYARIHTLIGISVLLIAILFAVLKFKKKLDEEIEEEMDDDFYDDDEEIREDYYALDYEDEE